MLNLEWQNTNSLRTFPLREGASGISNDGLILPTNAFLDFSGFVPSDLGTRFYLSSIEVRESLVVRVGISNFDTAVEVGSVLILADFASVKSYELLGSGLGVTGRLVTGPGMLEVQLWGVGIHTFSPEAGELEGNTLIPIETNVVTSVGILGQSQVLIGNVKLQFGRAMDGEASLPNNSLIVSAIKRVEDCEPNETGCPIKSINGLYPDAFGNLVLTAEGIFRIRPGTSGSEDGEGVPGLTIETIIKQDALCDVRQFLPGLRGPTGGGGGSGPSGAAGGGVICSPALCCECEECDTCENYEGTFFYEPPMSMGAALGGGFPGPGAGGGGGGVGSGLVIFEGDTLAITGINFKVMNDGGPGSFDAITNVVFCKEPCGSASAVPVVFTGNYLECVVPTGITTPPSTNNEYLVYLESYWGYTKPLSITIPPGTPTQLENFDPPSLGNWFDTRGPGFLFPAPQFVEGTGAFEVQNIFPFSTLVASGPMSGAGAPPWNFSGYSSFGFMYAKEFDPGEGAPADFVQISLTDSLLNTTNIFWGVLPTHRFPFPHVLTPADFQPVTVPIPVGPADLTDITSFQISTFDFGTGIGLNAWYDDLQGIP
jgi:hypothetical protein